MPYAPRATHAPQGNTCNTWATHATQAMNNSRNTHIAHWAKYDCMVITPSPLNLPSIYLSACTSRFLFRVRFLPKLVFHALYDEHTHMDNRARCISGTRKTPNINVKDLKTFCWLRWIVDMKPAGQHEQAGLWCASFTVM